MPAMDTDDQRDDLADGNEPEAADEADDTADAASPEPAKADADKRISDLQSAKDKETARANKLQKELERLQARGADARDGGSEGSKDPEDSALKQELREVSLDAVFGEFEQLRSYGIDRALIEGATRAEMRESATALVALIKSVETKARNAVMKEHGIKAEPTGTSRTPPKSYADMSAEEIEKEIAKAKAGGSTLW